MREKPLSFAFLTMAWLALVALTLLSLGLGEWFGAAPWLPLLMAAVMWAKGIIVAGCFIESGVAHPFIRHLVRIFVALSPLALVITAFFGDDIARWSAL
ncbi:hypothetical protein [Thiohalomonas denitrificans]|uniref:Cytochrome C oxidase subunit IV n=1 Tax=Thiohalomonas denitrificans TaxID=415747 RepID=A0A1G5PSH8_9GAMM|nr:hypothetical protein [Thiohalomonas denitrificans]SCZ52160.1 hypothetical protein SAMN03097708_00684 [Thiohalomonas denitrificans]